MTRFEDGPPNVEPRRTVIDTIDVMCMAARKARAKRAVSLFESAVEAERKAALNCPYQVHHGLYQGKVDGFAQFADALAFFLDRLVEAPDHAWYRPKLIGLAHDDASDGLSDDERAAVEAATEVL